MGARIGVFPGTFHPPTRAHLALAHRALSSVDRVLFVLPRKLPHKDYEGSVLEQRLRMLEQAVASEPRFSAVVSDGGLFIEIARELRTNLGPETDLWFLCGRDAAERIAGWDYGRADAFREQLREYGLLVAPRQGAYTPPLEFADRIRTLDFCGYDDASATTVRERIRRGEPWEHLVPPEIAGLVREIYGPQTRHQ